MADTTTITRYRGDTAADEYTIKDSSGTIIDITGYTFTMTVDKLENPPDDTTQLYQLTGSLTDPSNGIVEFVPSAVQADQKPKTYYYDVQMLSVDSRIKTIAKGQYIYTQDITK